MKSWKTLVIAGIVLACIAVAAGCLSSGSEDARDGKSGGGVTPQQVELIEQQVEQARQDLAALPPDDPGRLTAEKKLTDIEKLLAAYKANRQRQTGDDPDASFAAGVQTVAPFLPPPWNAITLIAGGLLPGVAGWIRELVRRRQAEQAGQDLARAIKSAALVGGGVVDFTDALVRESLKSSMPQAAQALVKDAGASVPKPFIIVQDADDATQREAA